MKQLLLILVAALGLNHCFSQSNTITYQDTNLISRASWQDTCFGLLNVSASQIPSGYLMDYSLMAVNDSAFNGVYSATTL